MSAFVWEGERAPPAGWSGEPDTLRGSAGASPSRIPTLGSPGVTEAVPDAQADMHGVFGRVESQPESVCVSQTKTTR
jgi:hypothetical protein